MSETTQKPLTILGAAASYIRREILTWPNAATSVRVACTFGICALPQKPLLVFVLAIVGAISDGVDGYLAQIFNQCTNFGKRYDQFADWGFGAALMYAIFVADGLTWYNGPLLLMIGGYLLLRATSPNVDTNKAAKIKTLLQFVGGVVILCAHAFEAPVLHSLGYVVVWASLCFMMKALYDYKFDNRPGPP